MKFCKLCVLPDTRPNLFLNSKGICNACETFKLNNKIDWKKREFLFKKIINKYKSKNSYDCIIPVSGGKDSTWQVKKILDYGLKPLTITWKTPARTIIGQKNLDNLIKLGVDHIDIQVNPKVESEFMLETFIKAGSTAIPMHFAIFNLPIAFAKKFSIPLIIYGENSAKEYGGTDKEIKKYFIDNSWLKKYGVTNATKIDDWYSKILSKKDLSIYNLTENTLNKSIRSIFMGHFFQWGIKKSFTEATKVGFKQSNKINIGLYRHTDIDCDFIPIHHWLKWYKFGFNRLMDNLSQEIRNKRITREKAIKLIKKNKNNIPKRSIKKFCKYVKISEKKFYSIAEKHRNLDIWSKKNGKWKLNNFIY
ncbi:N-acetyl sugar amidotransferase [Pelagibacteraceae bacterium]|nr:N-acetyl sugar amidotransferase [Pelagibacteraceae bacterium]